MPSGNQPGRDVGMPATESCEAKAVRKHGGGFERRPKHGGTGCRSGAQARRKREGDAGMDGPEIAGGAQAQVAVDGYGHEERTIGSEAAQAAERSKDQSGKAFREAPVRRLRRN